MYLALLPNATVKSASTLEELVALVKAEGPDGISHLFREVATIVRLPEVVVLPSAANDEVSLGKPTQSP